MSYPIAISKTELRKIEKLLSTRRRIHFTDRLEYIKAVLIGKAMMERGKTVTATLYDPKEVVSDGDRVWL